MSDPDAFLADAVRMIRDLPAEERGDAKVKTGMAIFKSYLKARPNTVTDQATAKKLLDAIVEVMNFEARRQWYEEGGITLH